jgi:2-polyprenyl-3-methyl-5-hydroxy-6-metoxy-1,4-benzoquinol methylase
VKAREATSKVPGLDRIPVDALEEVACGLCGGSEREIRFTDAPFSVARCRACGLTYVTPRLKDGALIEQVYDEGYWSSSSASERGYTDYRSDAPLYLRTFEKRMPIIRRLFPTPGRVLDVGCAAGYFLEVMQRDGWDVTGIEPSDAIRPQAEGRLGAGNVRGGLLHEAGLAPASFDFITLWDVIEHIPDFVSALRHVRTLLAPGGKILVETQNVASRAARVLGRKWQHYKHAEHIYHFEPKTIRSALEKAGFRVLENRPNKGGKYVSLGFVAERAGRLHPLLSPLFSPLKLVKGVAIYVNLYDEMVVVAEPR